MDFETITSVLQLWLDGGWVMIPLGLLALFIYATGYSLYKDLEHDEIKEVPEATWRKWIEKPADGKGRIGDIIRYTQTNIHSINDIQNRFDEVSKMKIQPTEQRITFISIFVTAAPLLGLLGTVIGMLATFNALASGTGGEQTIDLVASGISEALITTQTGLMIAIPGYFFVYFLNRKKNELAGMIRHMESVTLRTYKSTFTNQA